jgi:3-isopropylmalate/(R)-2-methylmalate dehydratase large subunit
MTMDRGKTVAEKILSTKSGENAFAGEIVEAEIDYVMVNDVTGPIAFKEFETLNCKPFVEKIVLIPDHFVPNKDISSAEQAAEMRRFARKYQIKNYFEVGKGGVCHQVMIDEGFAAPGRLIVGADSHTCTYGGLGAFSTGIGSSEAAACFAEGQLWFKVPESFKIELEGSFSRMVSGKDLIIRLITDMGVDGATYKALEFAGPGVRSVPVNERLTISNMAIEAGGKAGIFPADEMTLDYLGDKVRGDYQMISPDEGADYEREMNYDLSELDYMVAMPYSPGNGKPVEEVDVPIDQAYLGSCTNGRIEDLRTAAKLLKGKKVNSNVRMIVVPASTRVYEQAMSEGLLQIFIEAGAFISGPTCGACLGGYMGILASGERCVSSTNRNFIGRMGHKDSEVYLASPSVVAASAITGRIVTPETIL